jgi:hypothetical protein
MKSPVPFLKPKTYYESPIRSNVATDDIVNQVDPAPIVETQPEPEIKVIMSGEPSLDAMVQETKPKSKKSK